jgi:hypothetical protein
MPVLVAMATSRALRAERSMAASDPTKFGAFEVRMSLVLICHAIQLALDERLHCQSSSMHPRLGDIDA